VLAGLAIGRRIVTQAGCGGRPEAIREIPDQKADPANAKELRMTLLKPVVAAGLLAFVLLPCVTPGSPAAAAEKLHLFLLSGQSNMAGLNPKLSFTPTVTKALAPEKVLVVKDAAGGQPIRRWYKKWKPAKGKPMPKGYKPGDLYDRLMAKAKAALGDRKPTTITFVWMQGERDARERHGDVYQASFAGLVKQLRDDLGRKDVRVVIGRLSDFSNGNTRYKHWDEVRAAQVAAAEADPLAAWVDTDDLNGKKNGLHYDKRGYVELGKRFAAAALKLIKTPPAKKPAGKKPPAAK
jgi:hypothetical protein